MSLFNRLTDEEISKEYTHYARLHGVPIYFNFDTSAVRVRNWWPEWLLDLGEFIFGINCVLMNIESPMYAILLTGEIKHKPTGANSNDQQNP